MKITRSKLCFSVVCRFITNSIVLYLHKERNTKTFPMRYTLIFILFLHAQLLLAQSTQIFKTIDQPKGAKLGYSPTSGVKIIKEGDLSFKDLNRNGSLDKYEDWRLSADERAKDLASKMSVEQIAGLMLYSRHQAVPASLRGLGA